MVETAHKDETSRHLGWQGLQMTGTNQENLEGWNSLGFHHIFRISPETLP